LALADSTPVPNPTHEARSGLPADEGDVGLERAIAVAVEEEGVEVGLHELYGSSSSWIVRVGNRAHETVAVE
jgi:hypothetical protein